MCFRLCERSDGPVSSNSDFFGSQRRQLHRPHVVSSGTLRRRVQFFVSEFMAVWSLLIGRRCGWARTYRVAISFTHRIPAGLHGPDRSS